jgi:methyl-accepting chemotaxis protein
MKFKLSLGSKITALLAGLALFPFLFLGFWANYTTGRELRNNMISRTTMMRDWKASQIEQYFSTLLNFSEGASDDQTMVAALRAFGQGIKNGANSQEYKRAEANFTESVKHVCGTIGAAEIYLIDANGTIAYNSLKHEDLGTNLLTGEYKGSHLAALFREARSRSAAVDMAWYEPAREVTGYIGGPVTDDRDGSFLGVVAAEIVKAEINRFTQIRDGFGKTEEVYFVGSDFLMRSDSSLDPTNRSVEASFKNPALGRINTPSVREALSGKSGAWASTNYAGVSMLAAYKPIEFLGVKWALVAEISESEALEANTQFKQFVIVFAILGLVSLAFTRFVFGRSLTTPIQATVASLSSTSAQIAATVDEQERTAAQQAAAVNETSATVNQLGSSARQAAEQAEGAADAAARALSAAHGGQLTVAELLSEMSALREKVQGVAQQILRLSEQTSQIESITRLVSNLANQTNLLALNAAVEAARAGEHGKGFAVVAAEIRKLADESKRSTERISALVSDIQNATNSTVMVTEEGNKMVEQGAVLAQKAAGGFDSIIDTTSTASANAQQISLNVKQQAAAVAQVVEAMRSLNEGSKETVAGLAQTRASVRTLNDAAQYLKKLV